MTLQDLQTWVRQIEDITQAPIVAIKAAAAMTEATADLDLAKPARPALVRMGHINLGGDAVQGRAYVLGQPADVTIERA
ncbi:MAG: hypothetical protein ACK4Y4_04910 [Brevundimonas sp.]